MKLNRSFLRKMILREISHLNESDDQSVADADIAAASKAAAEGSLNSLGAGIDKKSGQIKVGLNVNFSNKNMSIYKGAMIAFPNEAHAKAVADMLNSKGKWSVEGTEESGLSVNFTPEFK